MKLLETKISGTEIVIFPIGDLHIGSPHCDLKIIAKQLEIIKNTPNARIILMGDLCETSLKDSVGAGVYEQDSNPQEQIVKAKNLLYPFRDIIDGIVTGNHEERVYKNSGVDLSLYFSQIMGLEHKYMRYQGIIKYTIYGRAYFVNVWHGAGGGGSAGASLNRLQKQSETIFADLYLMGHVHKRQVHTKNFFMPDPRHDKIDKVKQFFVVTGSALDYEDSYAEMAGMTPSDKGFTKIKFNTIVNHYIKDGRNKKNLIKNITVEI